MQVKQETPDKFTAAWATIKAAQGVLVPGGFGNRGVEGKIAAANYARVNRKPYLGICLGMQVCAWVSTTSASLSTWRMRPIWYAGRAHAMSAPGSSMFLFLPCPH